VVPTTEDVEKRRKEKGGKEGKEKILATSKNLTPDGQLLCNSAIP